MDAKHDRGVSGEPGPMRGSDLTRRLQAAAQNDADCRGILDLSDPHELDNILRKVEMASYDPLTHTTLIRDLDLSGPHELDNIILGRDILDEATYLARIKHLDLRREQRKLDNVLAAAAAGADCSAVAGQIKPDMVTMPAHYAQFKIEPIHFTMANEMDGFQCAIIKYVSRHKLKNGIEDIDKMLRYGQMYRLFLLGDPDWWKAPAKKAPY